MDSPHRFKLIDGTFSPTEASEILLSLLKSKVDHHRLRLASDEVRFGHDKTRSMKRIEELAQLEAALKGLLSAAAEQGQPLEVSGWVEIGPAAKEP